MKAKSKKILLITQTIYMYLMQLPLTLAILLARVYGINNTFEILFKTGLFMHLGMIPFVIINVIFGILDFIKPNQESISKTTLIVKIVLIPWYIMNFVICFLLVAGFLNPFLMLGLPLLLIILIGGTYINMLSTSIHVVVQTIRRIINKQLPMSTKLIIGIIFNFIFCLDFVGCILIRNEEKVNLIQVIES
ncbi:MAG: hypothetical protein HUJ61_07590 [Bacilli bacterium]|nr:hypothetical protein [Bacilli bacterium]